MPKSDAFQTEFLSVDLDIWGTSFHDKLLETLGNLLILLNRNQLNASFALRTERNLEESIMEIATIVQELPPQQLEQWHNLNRRVLNIGVKCGDYPHSKEYQIGRSAISAINQLRAEVAFTVYST